MYKPIAFFVAFSATFPVIAAEPCVGVSESYTVKNPNPLNRFKALKLHKNIMSSPMNTPQPMAWDGSVASCTAGNLTQSFREHSTRWLNYLRFLGGLRQVVLNCRASELAQEASLMMLANGYLDHNPPASWECFTQDGHEGAMTSNLASAGGIEITPTFPINMWFGSAGHRLWLLLPELYNYGFGLAGLKTSWASAAKVIYTEDPNNPPPPIDVVSWPSKGLYVYEDILTLNNNFPKYAFEHLVYEASGINLATADATFEINGQIIPLQLTHPNILGNQSLAFKLDNVAATAAFDSAFNVSYAARVKVTLSNKDNNNNITATLPYEMVWISRAGALIKPVGEMIRQKSKGSDWVKIKRHSRIGNPVIFLQSQTYQHQKPFVLLARRQPNLSFTLRKTDLNDINPQEDVQVLLMKPGEQTVEGGLHVKAQHLVVPPAGLDVNYETFSSSRPMLLAQIIDGNLQGAYTVQAIHQPQSNSYKLSVYGGNGQPAPDTDVNVDIVMVEKQASPIKNPQFTANTMQASVGITPSQINLQSDFTNPFLLGSVFTQVGPKSVLLRITSLTQNNATVVYKEAKPEAEGPTNPPAETADFLSISSEIARVFLYPTPPPSSLKP